MSILRTLKYAPRKRASLLDVFRRWKFRYEFYATDLAVMPIWLGFAWHDPKRDVDVYFPVPFNWLFRVVRDAILFLARGPQYEIVPADAVAKLELDRQALEKVVGQIPTIRAEEYWRGFRDGKAQRGVPSELVLLALERAKHSKI